MILPLRVIFGVVNYPFPSACFRGHAEIKFSSCENPKLSKVLFFNAEYVEIYFWLLLLQMPGTFAFLIFPFPDHSLFFLSDFSSSRS